MWKIVCWSHTFQNFRISSDFLFDSLSDSCMLVCPWPFELFIFKLFNFIMLSFIKVIMKYSAFKIRDIFHKSRFLTFCHPNWVRASLFWAPLFGTSLFRTSLAFSKTHFHPLSYFGSFELFGLWRNYFLKLRFKVMFILIGQSNWSYRLFFVFLWELPVVSPSWCSSAVPYPPFGSFWGLPYSSWCLWLISWQGRPYLFQIINCRHDIPPGINNLVLLESIPHKVRIFRLLSLLNSLLISRLLFIEFVEISCVKLTRDLKYHIYKTLKS